MIPANTPFANPQGKGLAPVLDNLQQAKKLVYAPAKNIRQISHEWFTSLFVLSSRMPFKPVAGRQYWLYRKRGEYRLSLIAPEQWAASAYGSFIGACELQADLTWTLQLSEHSRNDCGLLAEIACRRAHFEQTLRQAECIDDLLPFYAGSLSFYPRVLASALAFSLQQSMVKSGISGVNFCRAEQISQPAPTNSHRLEKNGRGL